MHTPLHSSNEKTASYAEAKNAVCGSCWHGSLSTDSIVQHAAVLAANAAAAAAVCLVAFNAMSHLTDPSLWLPW
jgi:hypothetical protein